MESDVPYMDIFKVCIAALIFWFIVKFMFSLPRYKQLDEPFFGGVAVGAGHPDCLRTLPEASQLLDMISSRLPLSLSEGVSDAPADYREMELLLSKMACLKKDLMSHNGTVDATRYQAFETAHDRIAVAELCGMCMSQNIPSRDLNIIFSTWGDRGKLLIRRLCTAANLMENDVVQVDKLFKMCFDDVYQIATSKCLKANFTQEHGSGVGGDVSGYMPENLKNSREYTNKYGGLSASGWNGAV